MNYNSLIRIYKWLYFTEVHYQNQLISIQNNFNSHHYHTIDDCYRLLSAEQRFNDFKQFSSDLCKILDSCTK